MGFKWLPLSVVSRAWILAATQVGISRDSGGKGHMNMMMRSGPYPLLSLSRLWALLLMTLLLLPSLSLTAKTYPVEQTRIEQFFPGAIISKASGPYQVRTLTKGGKPTGYAFQTIDVVNIPAYSGKPINMQILLDPKGVIVDAYVLEHHEPILLVGIPEAKLHDFSAGYKGVGVGQRVVVGHSSDPDAVTIDAITGATVTAMVVNEIVMHGAHKVALSLGLVKEEGGAKEGEEWIFLSSKDADLM